MTLTRRRFVLCLGLALFSIPVAAHANGVTLLCLALPCHILFGNTLIGLGEGWLLGRMFRLHKSPMLTMILANYASTIATGVFLKGKLGESIQDTLLSSAPLYNFPKMAWILVSLSLLMTILAEWPFCFWALRKGGYKNANMGKASLSASIAIQLASYALLVPWFYAISHRTVYTDLQVDRSLAFVQNKSASVYFIGHRDGDIYRMHLDGSGKTKVLDADIGNADSWLVIYPSKDGGVGDLYLYEEGDGLRGSLLAKSFAPSPFLQEDEAGKLYSIPAGYPRRGNALDMRPPRDRTWRVSTWGTTPGGGVIAYGGSHGGFLSIRLETPFAMWPGWCATILPGNEVVCQLGDQIVIIDLDDRKIGLLAMGRGPVVVLDNRK